MGSESTAGLIIAAGTICATIITSAAYLTKKIKRCNACGCNCEQTTSDSGDVEKATTPRRFFAGKPKPAAPPEEIGLHTVIDVKK